MDFLAYYHYIDDIDIDILQPFAKRFQKKVYIVFKFIHSQLRRSLRIKKKVLNFRSISFDNHVSS